MGKMWVLEDLRDVEARGREVLVGYLGQSQTCDQAWGVIPHTARRVDCRAVLHLKYCRVSKSGK